MDAAAAAAFKDSVLDSRATETVCVGLELSCEACGASNHEKRVQDLIALLTNGTESLRSTEAAHGQAELVCRLTQRQDRHDVLRRISGLLRNTQRP
jgi:hypothetical protein